MIVLACEGQSEVQLMSNLLDGNRLLFGRKEILDHRPIVLRQPKGIAPLINALPIHEDIVFYRIGDTQKDKFDTSSFSARKSHIREVRVCTKPEIEILTIINEGLYAEYMKLKSKMMPKQFLRIHRPDCSSFLDYVDCHDMTFAIKEYKRLRHNNKGELYLADLLR